MADFPHSKIKDEDSNNVSSTLGTTGTLMAQKRLLGDAGAGATGNGGWYRSNGFWKTFMLYNIDRVGAVAGGVDVKVEACMELAEDPNDPDVDTEVVELATLSSGGSVHFSTEHPWRYVRARVAAFGGAKNVQVGLFEQGQG